MKSNKFTFHLLAMLTVAVWGTTFVSTKVLIGCGLSAVEIFFYRFLLAYAGIWFVAPRVFWAKTWRDELLLLAAGVCGGSLYFVAENTALGHTLASNVALIVSTTPIFTAFLSYLFYRDERPKAHLIYGSLVALAGVALVVFNGSFILQIGPVGDLLTLLAALSWAFYGLILRRLDARYPVLFITRKVFFYGLVTLLPVFAFRPAVFDTALLMQPGVAFNLLFLGLLASLLCFISWSVAVKRLGVVRATNYIYIVPLVTLITSAVVIDETVTGVALFGAVLILGGVYVTQQGFSFTFSRFFRGRGNASGGSGRKPRMY